eukprot:TRINITY_DN419_c0_g1_i2.p1 TRINITY_DN419_c0_g1~~TRINITY_DN419_c0_g1_i2.p1  ORF type:complete len:322 (-),score=121.61 TRINITY_DN419_c0_g1_i2:222-1187(-)
MPEITSSVKFDNIAREWRCKWSEDSNKASLNAAQAALDDILADVSAVEGVASVQRVVCGGCHDFKVVTKLTAAAFGAWEKAGFAPEEAFLSKLKGISGITAVETQTYTLEEIKMNKKQIQKAQEAAEKKKAEAPEEKKAEDPAKKLKKVIKEGGKRGVEIEGAADMGGLQFFCTSVDEPEGDVELLKKSVESMNAKSDPTEEERKGGSGHIGKMVFSAGGEGLAIVAYVPEDKVDKCDSKEWLETVLKTTPSKEWKILESTKGLTVGWVPTDSEKGIFPLKLKEPLIPEANNFLRKLGLFPDNDSDDDDEMVFGDDDFPSM